MNANPEFPITKVSRVFNSGKYEMSEVYDFISGTLAAARANAQDVALLEMVTDEIFANVMSYAYESEKCADKWIELGICLEDEAVTMTFIDGGRPFDPLEAPTPDITLSAAERKIGGLGIHIVRSVMDNVSYSRDMDRNILAARKKISRKT